MCAVLPVVGRTATTTRERKTHEQNRNPRGRPRVREGGAQSRRGSRHGKGRGRLERDLAHGKGHDGEDAPHSRGRSTRRARGGRPRAVEGGLEEVHGHPGGGAGGSELQCGLHLASIQTGAEDLPEVRLGALEAVGQFEVVFQIAVVH